MTHSSIGDGDLKISSDRKNVSARLYSEDGYLAYKNAILTGAVSAMSAVCCQTAITPAPDGYIASVSGLQSVKALLSEGETSDSELLLNLTESLLMLFEACSISKTDILDCVLDYRAVFEDQAGGTLRFIYMPGLCRVQRVSDFGQLLSTVLLNIYSAIDEDRYNELTMLCSAVKDADDINEAVNRVLPLKEKLEELCDRKQHGLQSFFKKVFRPGGEKKLTPKLARSERPLQDPGYSLDITFEGDITPKSHRFDLSYSSPIHIKIGRNPDWADIKVDDLFVSRNHLEIKSDRNMNLEIGDLSENGTVIDDCLLNNSTYSIEKEVIFEKKVRFVLSESCAFLLKYVRKEMPV